MTYQDISEELRESYNASVTHPLQSFEWGEFRKKTGIKVIRRGILHGKTVKNGYTLSIHTIPHTHWGIGYLPKGYLPTHELLTDLRFIGQENKCIFIQLEPHVAQYYYDPKNDFSRVSVGEDQVIKNSLKELTPSAHPLFTKFTFQLDVTKPLDELLSSFHSKTRYNIKIALKHKVRVVEENTDEAFSNYITLMLETTKRQGFFAHTKGYHKTMWETLRIDSKLSTFDKLNAHLLLAKYKAPDKKEEEALTSWILFTFHDTLYYPYGASTSRLRNTMHSTLMMWEAIQFGKRLGLKTFDLWGSLGPNADPNDPWFGFHRFKQGFNPRLVEFVGSYDLVLMPTQYKVYKVADKLRWIYLRFRK